ncbi:unannotated protein [freshwater metagenome]|uniref:Unannotated protein n=1 Tax=freshwater metagenome TaxID=449393 RepID=A0A6J7FVL6_9ZZZZ
MAATLPPTDKQPIKNYAERNGDAEVDPLPTVDFEEKEVYGQSVPVLQNENCNDRGESHKTHESPRDISRVVALLLVFCRILIHGSRARSRVIFWLFNRWFAGKAK